MRRAYRRNAGGKPWISIAVASTARSYSASPATMGRVAAVAELSGAAELLQDPVYVDAFGFFHAGES
ncbi:MAG: hypothetical protein L0Y45_01435, partial [Woeseiaceae bacterium]|nr:hypothetical protein [Woeseiaceae bacterium]